MKERSLVSMILLSIFTLGIYSIYWYCSFQNQLKEQTGEGYGGLGHILASIFTLGIYSIVWSYKAGKRLEKLGAEDQAVLYLILTLVGFNVVAWLLMQHQANSLK